MVQLTPVFSNAEAAIVERVAEKLASALADAAIKASDDERDRTTAALAVFRDQFLAPLKDHNRQVAAIEAADRAKRRR